MEEIENEEYEGEIEGEEYEGDDSDDSDYDYDHLYYWNFLTIPVKWQKYILSYLSPKLRQWTRGVCSKLKQIVDEMPCGVINNQNFERTAQLNYAAVVRIENFTVEFKGAVMFNRTIRRLEFWGVEVSYNLFHLLQECPHVQELNFGNVILDSHKKIRCPEGLTLPEVKAMTFYTKWYVQLTVDELILLDILRNIKFGKLEQVVLHTCTHSGGRHPGRHPGMNTWVEQYDEVKNPPPIEFPFGIKSSELLAFLIENRHTIKTFATEGWDDSETKLRPFGNQIEDFAETIEQLQFESFNYYFPDEADLTGSESVVIQGQRKLKEIRIGGSQNCWPILSRAIVASASTLAKATVYISYRTGWHNDLVYVLPLECEPQDVSIFQDCSKLENLYLRTGTPILNMASLPDSIQILRLKAKLTQQDLLTIASKLCNLKESELIQVCGASAAAASQFMNNDIIQAFILIKTLESLYFAGFRGNDDEISNFAKSQRAFKIQTYLWSDDTFEYLTISKVLTSAAKSN